MTTGSGEGFEEAAAQQGQRQAEGVCFIVGSVIEVEAIRVPGFPEAVRIPGNQAKEQQSV